MNRNKEYYADPTPGAAEQNMNEEREASKLIAVFRSAAYRRGFAIAGTVKLKSEKTGKVYE